MWTALGSNLITLDHYIVRHRRRQQIAIDQRGAKFVHILDRLCLHQVNNRRGAALDHRDVRAAGRQVLRHVVAAWEGSIVVRSVMGAGLRVTDG